MRKRRFGTLADVSRLLTLVVLLAGPLASEAQGPGKALPGAPASRSVALEIQLEIGRASCRERV